MSMKSLETILSEIDSSEQEIVQTMLEMIRIPALAPINGGDGESRKADYLISRTAGFDSVRRIDVPDVNDPSVMRSNILAVKKGKRKDPSISKR